MMPALLIAAFTITGIGFVCGGVVMALDKNDQPNNAPIALIFGVALISGAISGVLQVFTP